MGGVRGDPGPPSLNVGHDFVVLGRYPQFCSILSLSQILISYLEKSN